MSWGRLVDVHDVDASGNVNRTPFQQDLVVNENMVTDAINYVLDRNPVTGKNRLIIKRTAGEPGPRTAATRIARMSSSLRMMPP